MPQNAPKILIISSDTGGGHRSAAQAISDGVQKILERTVGSRKNCQSGRRISSRHRKTGQCLQLGIEKSATLDEIFILDYQ